ncbi:UDP-galactopyranose mutase [Ahrensia kielensis]|uniref:UDP-galactopyranose mutase n=1 Tax=Ahrensia kielensis TaxID=76980 RepID=UPI00036FDE8E|nr:UDP-galactopyranose mutase [Ahrensia kielensis]
MKKRILIVGAGFSGAVMARELAEQGYLVEVIDKRGHVAGNCHTEIDDETGIMVHVHGPHIFHTDDQLVWDYINSFAEMMPYTCQVKATTGNKVYSLPINLLTINQFFNKSLSPIQAMNFIKSISEPKEHIRSFEDQALNFLGRELYEAFFHGYPLKQWGLDPSVLPASILKRLPIRFNYNDNYFNHKHQGIPREGYTKLVEKILSHERIKVNLNRNFVATDISDSDHIFYTGPLDEWFKHKGGRLGYRSLRFEASRHTGDFQGCAVMSYPDVEVPFTRITEHKHFTPWQSFNKTIVFHEYSHYCGHDDTPYYPIRLVEEKKILSNYVEMAEQEENVTFLGRLGTYRYLDMDVTIKEALNASRQFIDLDSKQQDVPVFFDRPL